MKIKEFIKNEWLAIFILSLPFFAIVHFWNVFPAKIQMHWNLSDGSAQLTDKEIGLFLIPGINIFFYFFFLLLPQIDNRKQDHKLFDVSFKVIRLCIISIFLFIFLLIFHFALGNSTTINHFIIYVTVFYFLIVSYFMQIIKFNSFFSFSIFWTKMSEESHRKTIRVAAKLRLLSSIAMLIAVFFIAYNILSILFLIYIAVIFIIPIIYSFFIDKVDRESINDEIV